MSNQTTITNLQDAIIIAATSVVTSVLNFLPNLLWATVIVIIGLIVAKWAKTLVKRVLELIQLSKMVNNTGINKFFEQAEVKSKIEEVIGEVFRWLILLVFFIAAVDLLGLSTVSTFLTNILGYIPRAISATLILAAGVLVAGWVESLIKGAVGSLSLGTGRLLGKVSSYIIVVFTILAAISELGIAAQFINTIFIGFVAMLALGLGLAFGLGAKEVIADILSEWYRQLKKDLK